MAGQSRAHHSKRDKAERARKPRRKRSKCSPPCSTRASPSSRPTPTSTRSSAKSTRGSITSRGSGRRSVRSSSTRQSLSRPPSATAQQQCHRRQRHSSTRAPIAGTVAIRGRAHAPPDFAALRACAAALALQTRQPSAASWAPPDARVPTAARCRQNRQKPAAPWASAPTRPSCTLLALPDSRTRTRVADIAVSRRRDAPRPKCNKRRMHWRSDQRAKCWPAAA